MRFGLVPAEEAIGAIAAHSVRADGTTVKKGTLVSRNRDAAEAGGRRDGTVNLTLLLALAGV